MARVRKTPLWGISEFGKVVDGTDVPMGTTEAAGFEVWAELTRYRIRSGFSGAVRASKAQEVNPKFVIRLQDVDLSNYADLNGLPESAITGDLQAAEPTAEVCTVLADELGTEEAEFYAIGPGPKGPRRVSIPKAVVESLPRLKQGRDGHSVLEATFEILEVEGRKLWEVTDNP